MFRTAILAASAVQAKENRELGYKNVVHCKWHWSAWSACSKACGGGKQTRHVVVDVHPSHGGHACPTEGETKACNAHPCPIDAVCGFETNMCSNDAGCGMGEQCTFWIEKSPAKYGGKECAGDHPEKTCKACQLKPCPVDAVCGFETNMCSSAAGCGTGEQCTFWLELSAAEFGGRECVKDHPAKSCEKCQLDPCPCDTKTMCSYDQGTYSCQDRYVWVRDNYHQNAATAAATIASQCKGCETCTAADYKYPVDAVCGWEQNMCSNDAGCGLGEQCSFWIEKSPAQDGGKECKDNHPAKVCKPCNLKPCPIDAVCGFETNMCSNKAGCGTGEQCTFWIEKSPAHYGGAECKDDHPAKECRACELNPCPIDAVCAFETNMCSNDAGCGVGEQCTFWLEMSSAQFGGRECVGDHPAKKCKPCNLKPCKVCDTHAKCVFGGEVYRCDDRFNWLRSHNHMDGNHAAAEVGHQCAACRDCTKADYTEVYVAGNSAVLSAMAIFALLFV